MILELTDGKKKIRLPMRWTHGVFFQGRTFKSAWKATLPKLLFKLTPSDQRFIHDWLNCCLYEGGETSRSITMASGRVQFKVIGGSVYTKEQD